MTDPETVVGCDVPGHPNNYVHTHEGGWRDCPRCQTDVHRAVIIRSADEDAPTLDEAMTNWHRLHVQGGDRASEVSE